MAGSVMKRAWVEFFDRDEAALGTRSVGRQESIGPPVRKQTPRRALGNASEVLNFSRLESASPEQHGLGETASDLAIGANGGEVVGRDAGNWSFGAVGTATSRGCILKSVVIGAEGSPLEPLLQRLAPETVRKESANGDVVDLAAWDLTTEVLPVVCEAGESGTLPAIMLSPLAVSVRGRKGRWHDDLTKIGPNLEQAVSHRLSRLTGRDVRLGVEPDRLYLRANPKHSTLVRTRAARGGRPAFVIGTMCPLSISGRIEDLRSAWALGIGEKNRYGFGCIGFAGRLA